MLKYNHKIDLKKYLDKYVNCSAVVVGSGPTTFQYEDLSKFNCPIFFINDTVRYESYAKIKPFFHSHHRSLYVQLVKRSTFLFPLVQYRGNNVIEYEKGMPLSNYIPFDMQLDITKNDYENNLSLSNFPDWVLDKEKVCDKNCLFGHTGTITTLLHFIWFCNFNKITFIGCNPKFISSGHDKRIIDTFNPKNKKWAGWNLKPIIENQNKFIEHFKLNVDFIGDYNSTTCS